MKVFALSTMKKYLLVMATAVLIAAFASSAVAWTVTITNSCNKDVAIFVYGSHFLWDSLDCLVEVKSGSTAACEMPWGICPVSISGSYKVGNSIYELSNIRCLSGIPCCWNSNAEVIQWSPDSCTLKYFK